MSEHVELSASQIGDEARGWVKAARAVLAARAEVATAATKASAGLQGRLAQVRGDGGILWHVLSLRADDLEALRAIANRTRLPAIASDIDREINRLVTDVGQAIDDLRKVTGFGRLLLFGGTRDKANQAVTFLTDYHRWYLDSGLHGEIERAAPRAYPRVREIGFSDALADWVGFARDLPNEGKNATIESAALFATLPEAVATIRRAATEEASLRGAALTAGNVVRNKETDRMLADMSVERLREASRDQIRVGALTRNGVTSVRAVLLNEHRLESFEGIGETSAIRIRAAAWTLRQTTFDEMPMRIDIKNRTPEHTEFLRRLRAWAQARRASASPADLTRAEGLAAAAAAIDRTVAHVLVVPTSSSTVAEFRDEVRAVIQAASTLPDAQGAALSGDPWDDFLSRPADYFALLAELGFITEDDEKTHGELPAEIIEAVREFELKGDHLIASLRGYQSFAARFALVQRKVIIGDEMGLGKTVEAIAVLAHLRAKGEHNFLVICPAAVVTNWVREVAAKSKLAPHRLHGPDRHWAAKNWGRQGGVAVTTFETLPWLMRSVVLPTLACVVVDEAHYIKNPDALRTQRTTKVITSCERAILLTGTPLENRLDEFRNLVGYIRSDLAVDADEFSPKRFRRQVAPAYLRRNQEDVLKELPELVEVDEWVTMSGPDASGYREAVRSSNFMAMRKAAMKQGIRSAKMQRLIEIVEEAEANGRRVVVFSYFLDVLADVVRHMPGRVFGPLTGSVAAIQRQVIIDEFSAAKRGAVLVAQIVAGGIGLNIQAASVVVICEPQFKPTTEWQAIARAHRMGQLESVQVHRLLSDEGVDLRLREILAVKKEMFENFARDSETAASAPEAYDVTEAELTREILADERQRLLGQGGPRPVSPIPATSDAPPVPERKEISARPHREALLRPEASSPATTPPETRGAGLGDLKPYPVFSQVLSPISTTSASEIVANVIRIISVEGPMTGWRIHQVYKECATGRESADEFSRLLNRAISAAERSHRILAENLFNRAGNKPRTFRLPSQSSTVARELGPRTIDIVPASELVQYCRKAAAGERYSDHELIERIGRLLGNRHAVDSLRNAILAAKRLDA